MSEASECLLSLICRLPYAVCAPKYLIGLATTGMAKYTSKVSVFVPNSTSEGSPILSKINERSELISISTNSGRHHPGCLFISGGLYGENELAAKFHVMWFISLSLLSLLGYPLTYISLLVVRLLKHILSLTKEIY